MQTCLSREQKSVAIVGGGDGANGGEWNGRENKVTGVIELVGYITQLHKFVDDMLKYIFIKENGRISINISLKFIPNGQINNILPLF